MECGLVHLYTGDGKGKTTAAVGLAVRAAGCGKRVGVVQFLKGADTGEQRALRELEQVTVLENPAHCPFLWTLEEKERLELAAVCTSRLAWAAGHMSDWELLVLDECLDAVSSGLLEESAVLELLAHRPKGLEVVLTGRKATPALAALADYHTNMEALRHPYTRGISARSGIEF
jgi:cob(I)alamin adenosyltransferase